MCIHYIINEITVEYIVITALEWKVLDLTHHMFTTTLSDHKIFTRINERKRTSWLSNSIDKSIHCFVHRLIYVCTLLFLRGRFICKSYNIFVTYIYREKERERREGGGKRERKRERERERARESERERWHKIYYRTL